MKEVNKSSSFPIKNRTAWRAEMKSDSLDKFQDLNIEYSSLMIFYNHEHKTYVYSLRLKVAHA